VKVNATSVQLTFGPVISILDPSLSFFLFNSKEGKKRKDKREINFNSKESKEINRIYA